MSSLRVTLIISLTIIYFALFFAERRWPLRKRKQAILPRLIINFTLTIMVFLVATLCIQPIVAVSFDTTQNHQFGLLYWLPGNNLSRFLLGFLLMDITFYYWHRLNHEIPLLWRFHNVHHVDPDLDVSTSLRFHAVEIAYSSFFRLAQLTLIGISPAAFFCYEFAFQANTFFQHSNLKLPLAIERLINKIIVTPRMHGIHHSNYRNETNRNYGVVFSFWDRLHQTIKLNIPQGKVTIGVLGYSQQTDNSLLRLLIMPFQKQRHYWRTQHQNHEQRKLPPGPLQD